MFRRKSQSGQGLVELGILVPFITLVLVGVVDFGRVLMVRHVITNAAREGARVACMGSSSSSESEVSSTVGMYIAGAGLDMGQAAVTITGVTAGPGLPATVTIGYRVTSLAMQMVNCEDSNFTMTASSSMPHE
jgi:Flp pilus assembly protein TadG